MARKKTQKNIPHALPVYFVLVEDTIFRFKGREVIFSFSVRIKGPAESFVVRIYDKYTSALWTLQTTNIKDQLFHSNCLVYVRIVFIDKENIKKKSEKIVLIKPCRCMPYVINLNIVQVLC